jgi:hypothetical protein
MRLSQRRNAMRDDWKRGAWALLLAAGTATVALAQAAPTAAVPVEQQAATARQWVRTPAEVQALPAFSPALELTYRRYEVPKPLRAWVARVDLTHPGVRFAVTEPATFEGEDADFETRCANTLEFARQRGVQLAFNASAFGPFRPTAGAPMDVVGLGAVRGKTYSEPDPRFGAVYITRGGRVALKGPPLPQEDLWHVVAGFRMVLDDRRVVVAPQVANSGFGGVNPRTAVGVDERGETLWVVVVDGRQEGVSEGITLVELACLFESLGAYDALNLDGGGSSTLVAERADQTHAVVNTPVGRGKPNTLRQVASNIGLYLPGDGRAAQDDQPQDLRSAVIRTVAQRRGGGYEWKSDGVARDIVYAGEPVLKANPRGTYCCGATLEAFLDAYRQVKGVQDTAGRWFEGWPREKFVALQKGWYGTNDAPELPELPAEIRKDIREQQVALVLPWTGLAERVAHYRLLERGDFVEFWRANGSGHSVIFWGRDWDEEGRERLWYWSSQKGGQGLPGREYDEPVAGYGFNWEPIGTRIDPERIYGATLKESE